MNTDDPLAIALWNERQRKPILEIMCPRSQHRLARVFNVPNLGMRLVTPSFKAQEQHLFAEGQGGDSLATQPASLWTLDDDLAVLVRCACGDEALFKRHVLKEVKAATQLGRIMIAPRTFRTR